MHPSLVLVCLARGTKDVGAEAGGGGHCWGAPALRRPSKNGLLEWIGDAHAGEHGAILHVLAQQARAAAADGRPHDQRVVERDAAQRVQIEGVDNDAGVVVTTSKRP